MESIRDRVYIITGGGGGIGRHIVRAFVSAGAKVAAVDRTLEHARPAEAEGGVPLAGDAGSAAGAAAMVRAVQEKFGRVDGLVHTVGGYAAGPLEAADDALYDRMFNLNVRSLFYAARAVLPALRARGDGFLAGFSSEPGWNGAGPGSALYAAAKSAVATLLRSLDGELTGTGIKVAIVYPMGAVDTAANRAAMPDFDPARYIDPAEIGEALVAAASRGPRARLLELPIFSAR